MPFPTITAKNAAGSDVTINTLPNAGKVAATESLSVAMSNEDTAIQGAMNETAPNTDTASSGLNGRLQRVAQRLTSLIALFPTSLGQKATAESLGVSLSAEQEAQLGSITETAPASDTASSGINGRLQRIAQRLTALFPASLGQKAMAASMAVVVASDQSAVPVVPTMGSSGNLSLQTNATGTNYTAFTSQACKQITVSNQSGTSLEFQQGATGVAFVVPTGTFYTFFGITNANQLGARRIDTLNTQVTITARWES